MAVDKIFDLGIVEGIVDGISGLFGTGTTPEARIVTVDDSSDAVAEARRRFPGSGGTGFEGHGFHRTSPFGGVGFADAGTSRLSGVIGDDNLGPFLDQVSAMDQMVASLAQSKEQLDAMTAAAQAFVIDGTDAETLMSGLGDRSTAIISAIDGEYGEFLATLEGGPEQIVARAGQAVQAMNMMAQSASRLSLNLGEVGELSIAAADSLAMMAGGLDNLAAVQEAYYQAVFSDTEKLSRQQEDLSSALSGVTDASITTTADLRALVEAQDLNTAAGRELAFELMQLAPALAQTSQAVERAITEQYEDILNRAPDAAGLSFWMDEVSSGAVTLEQALDAIANSAEAAAQATAEAAAQAAEALQAITQASDQALSELRGVLDSEIAAIQAQRQQLESSLASSKGSTNEVFARLQELVGAEKQAAKDRLDITTAAINEETSVRLSANRVALGAAKEGLSSISEEAGLIKTAAESLTDAIVPQSVQWEKAIARLRAALQTGDLTGAGVAATEAAGISPERFATSADFAAAQGQTAFLVSQLNDQAQVQLSAAEQTVQRLEAQTDVIKTSSDAQIESASRIYESEALRLDGILESASDQLKEQRLTNERLISVDGAIAALEISLIAESVAQKELDASTSLQQIESLNLIYDNAVAQLDALRIINSSMGSVMGAVSALEGAMAVESAASEGGGPVKLQGVAELYQELLGRDIRKEGAEYWATQLASGISLDDVRYSIKQSEEYLDFMRTGIPAFADGGMHAGGMRIVGERGPELEATGSSKIMSNSELMSSLGGNKQLAAEMKSMHSDMMQGLNMIAKNTNKGSRQLERWDLTGLPKDREFV